jgi:osmotically-inducible protein OsmY
MTRSAVALAMLVGGGAIACRPAGDPAVAPPQAFDPIGYPLVDARREPGYMPQIRTGDPPPEPIQEVAPEEVALDVANSLRADPITGNEPILVYAERGVVVLGGTVRTLQAERHAMTLALSVPGVGTVISRMHIDVPLRDDLDLEVAVQQALDEEQAVDAPRIGAQVDGGDLRLVGVVATDAERFMAEHVASGVPGVRSIQNRLQVSIPLAQSDEELETLITRRFEVEPVLSTAEIEVDVDGRSVWLTGVVPDERAFERARWIATRAAAVRNVDTTGLVIGEPPFAPPSAEGPAADARHAKAVADAQR